MKKPFSLIDFTENEIRTHANEIDANKLVLKNYLKTLVLGISDSVDLKSELPQNSDLESLFGASTALAFVFWQHLAVLERLQGIPEWIEKNPTTWDALTTGKKTCGLATTHLAKPGGAGIQGTETETGYLITGTAPWVCGHGIFDYLLVGFETNDAIHFAIIDFPIANPAVEPSTQEMICLNGTATVNLKFKNLSIKNSEWIHSRKKPITPQPRKTTFLIPELGIGKAALLETKRLTKDSNHPRHILVAKNTSGLEARLGSIETLKKDGESLDALVLLRDDFNRDAIRMLAIATGANALNKNSLAARLQMETFLLDSVIHSPTALAAKISKLGQSNT